VQEKLTTDEGACGRKGKELRPPRTIVLRRLSRLFFPFFASVGRVHPRSEPVEMVMTLPGVVEARSSTFVDSFSAGPPRRSQRSKAPARRARKGLKKLRGPVSSSRVVRRRYSSPAREKGGSASKKEAGRRERPPERLFAGEGEPLTMLVSLTSPASPSGVLKTRQSGAK
jgi:hypothetical protein